MKVVGICGSPRKGNTEWMLRKLLEGVAKEGADTELILLREKDIKGCDGCLACEVGGKQRKGICTIQDDMQQIYPKLVEADALALLWKALVALHVMTFCAILAIAPSNHPHRAEGRLVRLLARGRLR